MSPSRQLRVEALIALLIGGSLFAIVFDTDWYWPFSTYPMYASAVRAPRLRSYRLEGETAGGALVSLMGTRALEPFEPSRMTSAFRALSRNPDRCRLALADLLERYNRRVRSGALAGPPLVKLRLYLARWRLDAPELAPEAAPDEQVLVAQIGRGAPGP